MGTFGQYFFAFVEAFVDEVFAVDKLELFKQLERFEPGFLVFVDGHTVDGEGGDVEFEGVGSLQVLALKKFVFFAEVDGGNVAYAETAACNLVGIGGANAFEGGAYLGIAFGLLVGGIEETVGGEDEMRFL